MTLEWLGAGGYLSEWEMELGERRYKEVCGHGMAGGKEVQRGM